MKVQRDALVELEFSLTSPENEVLEEAKGEERIAYVHGYSLILPGIETALEGRTANEEFEMVLAPEDAFGQYDPEKFTSVPRDEFPDDLALDPGEWISAMVEGDDGDEEELELRVVESDEEAVVLDANPKHAGVEVRAWVRVGEIRPATASECAEAAAASATFN